METQEKLTFEKPEILTPQNVCYWYEKSGELIGTQKSKAKKFLRYNCIEKISDNMYICKPLKGYNITTHKIRFDGEFKCSCQWNTKNDLVCSHIMAVKLFLFMEKWKNKNLTQERN